jgi:hypothetical protein
MAGRQIPPQIMQYLGPCREPRGIVEKIIEQIRLAKCMGGGGFTDYDPLLFVMYVIGQEIEDHGGTFDKPKARRVWCKVLAHFQADGNDLEHNTFLPCRYCDQAFLPVIDEKLLTLFLAWYESQTDDNLLAIHRCPACGGTLEVVRSKTYKGDWHTPAPRTVHNDEEWAVALLSHVSL